MHLAVRLAVANALWIAGCATGQTCCNPCPPIPTAPAVVRQESQPARAFAFHDGKTGGATTLEAFLAASRDADLIAFGELHGHPIGARAELQALEGMAAGPRPVALALEFLERDAQGAIDDYLAGRASESDFLKAARQGPAYASTHRPLVEFAKAHRLAVLAANAPRRLVTAYRKRENSYADYLAGLSETDRGFLPASTTVATGPYLDRFTTLMGAERASKLMKAQSLWDDAMADVVASHRAAHPDARVLLVVGAFHVAGRLGTIAKYRERRPNDRVGLLVMTEGEPPALAFDPGDRDEGDVILTVAPVAPPPLPAAATPPPKAAPKP